MIRRFFNAALVFTLGGIVTATSAGATTAEPLRVVVDASHASQKIYHVDVTLPATPGPFTFVYPKWIPGYHAPAGPIEAVVSLRVSANGMPLEWRRDLVDAYAVHTSVPSGARALDVAFDVVAAASHNGQNQPVSTSQLALVEFSNFVVYPQGATAEATPVDASLTLPAGWSFEGALAVRSRSGNTVDFARASLYTLVDSPVIAGAHERRIPLGGVHELDLAADSAEALEVTPKFITGMKHLVVEGPALYGGAHYRDYHFLLTLSDAVGFDGIEHHESSDNRAPQKYASEDSEYRISSDLLPHEYSHSWNGKFRRPADLAIPDYQQPEKTDLLWVYEGLNQYVGEVLATRARLSSFHDRLDALADSAAAMDSESGRAWRPIRDAADGAPFLYSAPDAYGALRRSTGDFYTEGALIWLDADVTIRRLTHGAKSLDDFLKLWGDGSSTSVAPAVRPYDERDVYALLARVAPYDWAAFFTARVANVARRAPLGGIVAGGYRLAYTAKAPNYFKAKESAEKNVDARYSLGAIVANDGDAAGTIEDVLIDSPAFRAGLAPGTRIVAIDGRKWTADVLHDALRAHKGGSAPLQLIVSNDEFFRVVAVDARDGERYPQLVRDPGASDVLAKIYAPKTFAPLPEASPDHL